MDNPREDILVPPGYTLLMFGDGYLARTSGSYESKDENGISVVKLMIEPSRLLRKRYNITDNKLNNNNQMEFTAIKEDLITINMFDDASRRFLYLKTFDGQETELGKSTWNIRTRLIEEQKKVWLLEGELIYLNEQLKLAKNNPIEYLSQLSEALGNVSQPMLDILNAKKGREVNENE